MRGTQNGRRILLGALAVTVIFTGAIFPVSVAELTYAQTASAAARLTELGYLAKDYTPEMLSSAIEDFQLGNDLRITGELDEATLAKLSLADVVSQEEYLDREARVNAEYQTLSEGDQGNAVIRLQQKMVDLGYYTGKVSGSYGIKTILAVKRFQTAYGLEPTGIADASVRSRLNDETILSYSEFLEYISCKRGDAGENVRTLQKWLLELGYSKHDATGIYGVLTAMSVQAFQKENKLDITGSADVKTVKYLLEEVLTDARGLNAASATEVCDILRNKGYKPGDTFNSQTELELMRYQYDNGLAVTGFVDTETMEHLRTNDNTSNSVVYREINGDDIAECAYELIGSRFDFDSGYRFVEYVYLLCGNELPREENVQIEAMPSVENAVAGDVLMLTRDDVSLWGIYTPDGGVVILRNSMVMVYYPRNESELKICRVIL